MVERMVYWLDVHSVALMVLLTVVPRGDQLDYQKVAQKEHEMVEQKVDMLVDMLVPRKVVL
jgi:hypothetical protein